MSIIELLKYILVGIVQGITEILPISSSGHIVILAEVFGLETNSGYILSTLLNLGSFVVIFFYFLKFEIKIIKGLFAYVFKKDRTLEAVTNFKYFIALVIGSIPIAIVGIIFYRDLGTSDYNSNYILITGICFFATASILYLSRSKVNQYTNTNITYKDGLLIGLLQPVALLPGLSRLALTTCAGLHRKKSMETSLTFSFLLYLPISFGQLLLSAEGLIANNSLSAIINYELIYYLGAFFASVLFTYLALKRIFIWVRKGSFNYFAIYNFVIGMTAFIFALITL